MLTLSKTEAKKFFDDLYDQKPGDEGMDRGDFYEISTRVVARSNDQTTVGTTALQALILNYLESEKDGSKALVDVVSIAHISRPGVGALLKAYPNITLKRLIELAKENGYEVEVIGGKERKGSDL